MADFTTVFVSGKVYWAKVFVPVMNYEGTGKEWTMDFVPDDVSFLKEHKLLDRLKENDSIPGDFIKLRKPTETKDGEKNDPIRVYNEDNEPWPENTLIGNGSDVDVKLTVADWGKGKKKSIWIKSMRVTDLVPYVSNEFSAMDKAKKADTAGEEFVSEESPLTPKKKTTKKSIPDDLDDDLPF